MCLKVIFVTRVPDRLAHPSNIRDLQPRPAECLIPLIIITFIICSKLVQVFQAEVVTVSVLLVNTGRLTTVADFLVPCRQRCRQRRSHIIATTRCNT